MRFLRQAIERKLSELLGMPVAMETVELALFRGAVSQAVAGIGCCSALRLELRR